MAKTMCKDCLEVEKNRGNCNPGCTFIDVTHVYRAGQEEFRKVGEQVVSVWAGDRGAGYGKGNLDRAIDELRKVLALPLEGDDG